MLYTSREPPCYYNLCQEQAVVIGSNELTDASNLIECPTKNKVHFRVMILFCSWKSK